MLAYVMTERDIEKAAEIRTNNFINKFIPVCN